MSNPYEDGTPEHLLYAIFGEPEGEEMSYKADFSGAVNNIGDLRDLDGRGHITGDARADNELRATWAGIALLAFTDRVGVDDFESSISDLVADLRHLCDAVGADWDAVEGRAAMNYTAEIAGEL